MEKFAQTNKCSKIQTGRFVPKSFYNTVVLLHLFYRCGNQGLKGLKHNLSK